MSARKTRPAKGEPITKGMSMRDMAAALSMSTGEINRWMRLGAIPEEEFERRLAEQLPHAHRRRVTATSLLRGAPVPALGRVDRAKGLFNAMTPAEQAGFIAWLKLNINRRATA